MGDEDVAGLCNNRREFRSSSRYSRVHALLIWWVQAFGMVVKVLADTLMQSSNMSASTVCTKHLSCDAYF
jgi:hypothetical protein